MDGRVLCMCQLALAGAAFGQGEEMKATSFRPGYLLNTLSVNGLAPSVCATTDNFISSNPATRFADARLVLGLSMQHHTVTRWAGTENHVPAFLPFAAAAQYRFRSSSIHLGYTREYCHGLEARFERTTPWEPEGTGEYSNYSQTSILNQFAVGFVQEMSFSIWPTVTFRAGLQHELLYAHFEEILPMDPSVSRISTNDENFSRWRYGFLTTWQLPSESRFVLGFHYYNKVDIHSTLAISPTELELHRKVGYVIPAFWGLGCEYTSPRGIATALNILKPMWQELGPNYAERYEYSGSVSWPTTEHTKFLIGIQTSLYPGFNESFQEKIDALFLVAGYGRQFENADLDFVVADGRLFNHDWQQQTIVKLAVGYRLGQ